MPSDAPSDPPTHVAFNAGELDADVAAVEAVLRDAVTVEEERGLQLTGLEPVLLGLAFKAVVGVASGFAGKEAHERWKAAKTRRALERLQVDLGTLTPAVGPDRVDVDTIRFELVTALTTEGLSVRHAERLTDAALERVGRRLTGRPQS